MTESNSQAQRLPADPVETPEDVATLYSWANLHGAKYRDFSASRAEAREEARLRAEEARSIERRRLEEEAERKAQEEAQIAARLAAEAAEAARQAEAERLAEIARQAEAERQAVLAAQEAQRRAAQQRAWQPLVQPGKSIAQASQTVAPAGSPDQAGGAGSYANSQFYKGSASSPQTTPQVASPASYPPDSNPFVHVSQDLQPSSDSYKGFINQVAEASGPSGPSGARPVRPSLSGEALNQQPFGRANDPFAPFAPVQTASAAPSRYPHRDSFQDFPQGDSIPAPYPNQPESVNESLKSEPFAARLPGFLNPSSSYRPEPLNGLSQANTMSGSSIEETSSEPYVPQLVDSYSPWQAPLSHETPQELYEQRESLSGPAWLVPDFGSEASSKSVAPNWATSNTASPKTATQAPSQVSPLQAQYSAGTTPSADPTYSFQQPQAPPTQVAPAFPVSGFKIQPAGSYRPQSTPSASLPVDPPSYPRYPFSAELNALQPTVQAPSKATNQDMGQLPESSPVTAGTLIDSRDRISQRWYALKSVFDPHAVIEKAPAPVPVQVPSLAIFSLAGGVGKTTIVAALGRALSSRGERILLVDTSTYGLLPFFFGARDQRPGRLRTFNPPTVSSEAPIQLVTLDPEGQAPESNGRDGNADATLSQNQDWLPREISNYSRGSSRILIDLPTASGATTRRILKLAPVVLVPVVPDMSSVVSVGAIESFFRNSAGSHGSAIPGGTPIMPYYVLNQFDYSLPLHLDVSEILREQIGDRLLPFALRRNPAISEALAEGMTVMDYAPTANVAEDYASLAGWARSIAAPANVIQHGVRWSER